MVATRVLASATAGSALPAAYDLRVEYEHNPIGLTETAPRFSWRLPAPTVVSDRGLSQASYQLTVTHRDTGASVWDSGKVASNSTYGAVYDGAALTTETAYSCSLQWWSVDGRGSALTRSGFEMAPLSEGKDGAPPERECAFGVRVGERERERERGGGEGGDRRRDREHT
jgi:alpha-L-rhamnosidase